MLFEGGIFTNYGTINWNSDQPSITTFSNATIVNQGIINIIGKSNTEKTIASTGDLGISPTIINYGKINLVNSFNLTNGGSFIQQPSGVISFSISSAGTAAGVNYPNFNSLELIFGGHLNISFGSYVPTSSQQLYLFEWNVLYLPSFPPTNFGTLDLGSVNGELCFLQAAPWDSTLGTAFFQVSGGSATCMYPNKDVTTPTVTSGPSSSSSSGSTSKSPTGTPGPSSSSSSITEKNGIVSRFWCTMNLVSFFALLFLF